MEDQITVTILTAIISTVVFCAATGFFTWLGTRSGQSREIKRLEKESKDCERQLAEEKKHLNQKIQGLEGQVTTLAHIKAEYDFAREKLDRAGIVKTYKLPVLLVGPRGVGKTSLLMQWYAPWDGSQVKPTEALNPRTSDVPIYDFKSLTPEPHFAIPSLSVEPYIHLKLKVFDFPGELSMQKKIVDTVIEETNELDNVKRGVGISLICMFNAEEAAYGITRETHEYYNGELFRELRRLVMYSKAKIGRFIIVFNKFDNLRKHYPLEKTDQQLLTLCLEKFQPVYNLFSNICNKERYCEVITILDRADMHLNNRGATVVKGEAARAFVEAFAGKDVARAIIEQSLSTFAIEKYMP